MKRHVLLTLLIGVLMFSLSTGLHPDDKSDAKLAKMEKQLEAILGTNTSWKAAVFKDLRLGMPCKEVKKYFRSLKCNPGKAYDFPKVSGKLLGKIKEYKFTFKKGLLQDATIVFGARAFDSKRFATALLNVAQRKWGNLSPEKLQKKNKVWVNSDYDTVTLYYVNVNWHLKISMPKRDTGEVLSGSMTEAEIRTELAKLLGSDKSWLTPSSSKFRRGYTCSQVQQVYQVMKGCDATKSYSIGTVTIKDHSLVHGLKFGFKNGQLQNITFVFHRQLPKELFKKVSLELFQKKWGQLKPEKQNKDILTLYKRDLGIVQRMYSVDHWEIKQDFPK